jgi:hypothetical protein
MNYIISGLLMFALMPIASANWPKGKSMDYKVIEFNKGVTSLTVNQKTELMNILKDLKAQGKEVDISIATWADEPFPGANKSLSDVQQKIADNRIASIKKYMNETKIHMDDIESYSMAEGSNWLARLINTEGAELKSMFSKEDPNASLMKEKYQIFKDKGNTSKSVVVFSLSK